MKKTLMLFSLLVFSITMMAQQNGRGKFNPEEFKAKLESYVTAEVGFTQAEAQAFYPIFFEMKGKHRPATQATTTSPSRYRKSRTWA